ncbi:MAG: hypothetical protein PUG15_06680 [Bacteroidales bacterium]|nr:hypothetical protein [Bacteroidales bacterium]
MKKLFLISISFLPALMFAASFSPYLGDEDWGGQGAGSDFLQNFVNPDAGDKARPGDTGYEDGSLNDYTDRVIEIGEYYCPYCQENTDNDDAYFECLSEIYDAGVLPVKDGDGKIIRFEFPECKDPQCPIHHLYGYAADTEGNITEITPPDDVDPMGQTIEKPRLPVGEPFVMLLFAGVYAIVRKRQNAAKA